MQLTALNPLNYLNGLKRSLTGIKNLGFKVLDKLTLGRGLKIWQSHAVKRIKAKNEFSEFHLDNGLKVLFKQAQGQSLFAELNIKSGGANDPKGKEGIAHLFEHLLCRHNSDFQEAVDAVVQHNGGSYNACTSSKDTSYFTHLPGKNLDLALNLMAGLFAGLKITAADLEKEKRIVINEITERDQNPHHELSKKIREFLLGKGHPITSEVGGDSESVASISMDDVQKFYATNYTPSNATLIISGDFDQANLKRQIEKYFASIPSAAKPKELDCTIKWGELSKKEIIRDAQFGPSSSLLFPIKPFDHRTALTAGLVSYTLSGSTKSRLYKRLVDPLENKEPLVKEVDVNCTLDKGFGFGEIAVNLFNAKQDELSRARIHKIIQEEIKDIQENGVQADELSSVIADIENEEIYKKDYQHSDIGVVAIYDSKDEDWTKYLDLVKDLCSITNEEIKDYAKNYLNFDSMRYLEIYGQGNEVNSKLSGFSNPMAHAHAMPELEQTVVDLAKIRALSGTVANEREFKFSGLKKYQVDDANVYHKEDHSLPLVFVDMGYDGGMASIPKAQRNIARIYNALLSSTGVYDPQSKRILDKKELEEKRMKLGFSGAKRMGDDDFSFGFHCISRYFGEALGIFTNFLLNHEINYANNPEVRERLQKEFDSIKKTNLESLALLKQNSGYHLNRAFYNSFYPPEHLFYLRSADEIIGELQSITLDDVLAFHRNHGLGGNPKLTVLGDITKEQIDSQVLPVFKAVKAKGKTALMDISCLQNPSSTVPKPKLELVTVPNNGASSDVIIGNLHDIKLDDPDHRAAELANYILGAENLNSRLYQHVREKAHLVYSISSGFSNHKYGSRPFEVNFTADPRLVKQVLVEVHKVIKGFLDKGITDDELEIAKSHFKSSYAMDHFNSRRSTHSYLSSLHYRDKDEDYINSYNQLIDSISKEDVLKAAKRLIRPEQFKIVVSKPTALSIDVSGMEASTQAVAA
jgi:zinc protease